MELGVSPAVLQNSHGASVASAAHVTDEACRGIVARQARRARPTSRVAGVAGPVRRGGAERPLLVWRPADVLIPACLPGHQDVARLTLVEARRLRPRGRGGGGWCGGHVVKKHRKGGQGEAVQQAAATPGRKTTDEMCGGDRTQALLETHPTESRGPPRPRHCWCCTLGPISWAETIPSQIGSYLDVLQSEDRKDALHSVFLQGWPMRRRRPERVL